MSEHIKNVTIVGSGLMGCQIALVTAAIGYKVTMIDRSEELLERAKKMIHERADQYYRDFINNHENREYPNGPALLKMKEELAKHGKFDRFLENIHYTSSMTQGMSKADLAIEAVFERLELKQDVFEQMEASASKNCVLATNTSSLLPSDIAKKVKRKENFGCLHFYNPIERKRFLEVGRIKETSIETLNKLTEYSDMLGKSYVVATDCHGVLCNRMMLPLRSEALYLYEQGIATPEDIDKAIKLGYQVHYGPFEYMDTIGLETVQDILTAWYNHYRHECFIRPPSKTLAKLVSEGKFGKKTGEGFYKWENGEIKKDDKPTSDKNAEKHIKNVTIVGAGTIGSQIAMLTSAAGYIVTLVDRSQEILENTKKNIHEKAEKFYHDFVENHEHGEFPNSPALLNMKEASKHGNFEKFLQNIHYNSNIAEGLSKADLAIEAVYERLELKQEIFAQMEAVAPKNCVLATNTSSLLPSDIAKKLKRKENFGGLHYFNPIERKRLLEVGKIKETSEETLNKLFEYATAVGKTYVLANDCHGFIANRMMIPVRSEAIDVVERGIATPADIDKALTVGYELGCGPFEYMDIIGLDTVQDILTGWYNHYKDEVFIRPPSKILSKLVLEKKLGKKTGEGFFKWENGNPIKK
uniref:3-hydroxyacyl-CoA dehydrogenase n=1 Tax=Acrobeloides nanus TaxID=290746 RepID=A0A914DIU5_9BILA